MSRETRKLLKASYYADLNDEFRKRYPLGKLSAAVYQEHVTHRPGEYVYTPFGTRPLTHVSMHCSKKRVGNWVPSSLFKDSVWAMYVDLRTNAIFKRDNTVKLGHSKCSSYRRYFKTIEEVEGFIRTYVPDFDSKHISAFKSKVLEEVNIGWID